MKKQDLFRPLNQAELDLILQLNWKAFPPRLADQPIFYPVLNEAYATQITKEWNVPAYGVGHVVQFSIPLDYFQTFKVQTVGAAIHQEIWVPAEELGKFNFHIIDSIKLVSSFYRK